MAARWDTSGQKLESGLLEVEFFKVEIVYHAAEPREVVVTLDHFRQFVVDERRREDGVEMPEHHRVQLRRESPEEKVLWVESLGERLGERMLNVNRICILQLKSTITPSLI